MKEQIKRARREVGRLGGLVTLERYGRDQLRTWGKLGGRPRSLTYDEIMRQHQLVGQKINDKEGTGPPGNMTELKKHWRLRCRSSSKHGIPVAGTGQETPQGLSLPKGDV
jgi:hypothetical protein